MSRVVHITAPSRLHFGLWSLAQNQGRQFGGVGAMIERPGLRLSVSAARELTALGPHADRVLVFAQHWAAFHHRDEPSCFIEVQTAFTEHAGLGMGTQLGLSIAAALSAYFDLPEQTPAELAMSVGRGLRSAVGTYGFVFGGLIVEQGKLPEESVSPLECRIDLPPTWRFVLVRPHGVSGLAGEDEATAFGSLPSVPSATTDRLVHEARDRLIPAAVAADFPTFADSVYTYGHLSGECFAARQGGGPFHGPVITRLVQQVRDLGYAGVGQSSWGPTVFVCTPSHDAAEVLVRTLKADQDSDQLDLTISSPSNQGARIEISEDAEAR